MIEKINTPKIRFKGFTDDWEQRKFVETFDFLPNNSLSRAQLTYENGTVKNVHYGDVLIKFGELLDVGNEELPYLIDDSLIKNYSSAVLKNGDVVIADAAEDETVGKCSEIKGIKDEKILSGLHTIPVRPRVGFENGYLGYFMNSHSYHDQLLPLIQGTKVSSISKKILENTVISYPASSSEQEKIATFFESLTNLITLHQRKYENLKNVKRAMLQKMFPKKGDKFPEIRFKDFTDDWEQRKVDDITSSYSGGTPQAGNQDYYNGDIPFIRSGEIYQSHTELFITQKGLNNSSAKMVSKGDILYALYGATSGEVSRSKLDGAINQAILAIHPKDDFNADFLVEWFRKEKDNIISRYLQGGQGNLSAQIIKNLDVMIPSSSEQKMIGDFFSNLNNLITLHQRKYEMLINIKQAMLEKMFIKQ